jgi:hypothetical protein
MARHNPERQAAGETEAAPVGKVQKSLMTGMALKASQHHKARMDELVAEVRYVRQYITGKKHFVLPGIAQVKIKAEGNTQFNFIERIPNGQTFIGTRLTAQAPEECQLELYKNSVSPDNFLEVVANIQVYANSIPGDMIVEGPAEIIAVVSKAKVAGNCSINLSGFLIPTHVHRYVGKSQG